MDEICIRDIRSSCEYLFQFEDVFESDELIYYVTVHVYKNSTKVLEKNFPNELSAKAFVNSITRILTA